MYNIYKASVSPSSAQQNMPYLLVAFATTAVLDTWTVVCLTAAKFKPLVFLVGGVWSVLPPGKRSRYPLYIRLCGPQSWSGLYLR
jgi:hypothetical protein